MRIYGGCSFAVHRPHLLSLGTAERAAEGAPTLRRSGGSRSAESQRLRVESNVVCPEVGEGSRGTSSRALGYYVDATDVEMSIGDEDVLDRRFCFGSVWFS